MVYSLPVLLYTLEAMNDNCKKIPAKGQKKKTTQPTVSAVLADGTLVEALYRSDEKTLLCLSKDGVWGYKKSIFEAGIELVPYSPQNNLLKHEAVLLSSEPEDYESEEALVTLIQSFIHKYADVSPLFEEIASYYVLLSWVYDSFNELPYLRLRGGPGSGKTRFLLTVGSICYKPMFASGASTVSPIFRMLDSVRGTLVIDEGDFRASDERAEIVKIFNNGNARGFPVLRSEVSPQGEYNPKAYSVFGPKIIATRRAFEDQALESRCITEEMGQKRLRADIPISLPAVYKEEALTLRNKLLAFRLKNFFRFTTAGTVIDRGIEPRVRQIFAPLLSIIKEDSAQQRLLDLAWRYHQELTTERGMDIEAQVLEVIRDLIEAEDSRLSIREITSWFLDRYGDEYDRKVTPKWIGSVIRTRLHLRTQKSHGVFVIPIEERPKLKWLFEKYGITDEA